MHMTRINDVLHNFFFTKKQFIRNLGPRKIKQLETTKTLAFCSSETTFLNALENFNDFVRNFQIFIINFL